MKPRSRFAWALPSIATWASLAALAGALSLRFFEPPILERAELAVFDTYQRWHPRVYEPLPVRIIDIDDASLQRMGQWPWPRTHLAELVRALARLDVAVVAFDVVFAEPDRTSPAQVLPLWAESADAEFTARAEGLPDHDAVFAQAFREMRVVAGFVLMDHAGGRVPEPKAGVSHLGDDPRRFLPDLLGGVPNLPALHEAASGAGSFALPWPERDGVLRRVPLLFRHGEVLHPSLAAEALRVATAGGSYLVKSSNAGGTDAFGAGSGIVEIRIGREVQIPTDRNGRVWIHFTEAVPERYVPAWQVLDGSVNPELLAGHIVFVGTSAEGLKDIRATPRDPATPGVQLHAELVEQVLTGHYLERPDWAKGAEFLGILAIGLLLIVLLPRVGALWCAGIGVAGLVLAGGFSYWAFREHLWLVAPVYAWTAIVFVYLTGSLSAFLRTEGERREVRSAFGRYVAPRLVEELARDPGLLRLGGETREMTVLFCDIRGFTTISEQLDPEELTSLVNRFLTPMTRVILDHGGTIDKYMGDCIMAFWNAPLEDPEHARHACEAALEMEAELGRLNETLAAEAAAGSSKVPRLRMGIGINTGPCCVGNFGSDQRFDYSVISDEVNLASRLEGQSKTYGLPIIVGDRTSQALEGFATLELDRLRVKGRAQAEPVHALLGGADVAGGTAYLALLDANEAFLAAYRAGRWAEAREALARCRELDGSLETLWGLHSERLTANGSAPAAADWEGVHEASDK